ncbi:hypothetical protein, partial [Cronobacter sakazakii]
EISCVLSSGIRKKAEADLRTPPHRADARKHKICLSVSCLLIHMLCYPPFRDAARSRRYRRSVKIMNVVHFRKSVNTEKIGSYKNGRPVIYLCYINLDYYLLLYSKHHGWLDNMNLLTDETVVLIREMIAGNYDTDEVWIVDIPDKETGASHRVVVNGDSIVLAGVNSKGQLHENPQARQKPGGPPPKTLSGTFANQPVKERLDRLMCAIAQQRARQEKAFLDKELKNTAIKKSEKKRL